MNVPLYREDPARCDIGLVWPPLAREAQGQAVEDDVQAVAELGVAELGGVGGRRSGVRLGQVVVAGRGFLGRGHKAGDEPAAVNRVASRSEKDIRLGPR
jgi:hypothetical protein